MHISFKVSLQFKYLKIISFKYIGCHGIVVSTPAFELRVCGFNSWPSQLVFTYFYLIFLTNRKHRFPLFAFFNPSLKWVKRLAPRSYRLRLPTHYYWMLKAGGNLSICPVYIAVLLLLQEPVWKFLFATAAATTIIERRNLNWRNWKDIILGRTSLRMR